MAPRKKPSPETAAAPVAAPDLATVLAGLAGTLQNIDSRLARLEGGGDDRGAEPRATGRRASARTGQERASATRRTEERVMPHMAYQSILYVDPRRIPPDVEYFWVRESVLGQADDANVTTHQMAAWRPVPASRHPELIPPPLPGREQEVQNCIRRPGLILMEKPLALVQQGRDYLRQQNMQMLMSQIKGGKELNEDARMPWTVEVDRSAIESIREFK